MKQILILLFTFMIVTTTSQAQKVTYEDYNRAVSFMHSNLTNKTDFNLYTNVNWFEDNSGIWFINYSKGKKTYKTVNFNTYKVADVFNHEKLATALSKFSEKSIDANTLSITNIERLKDGNLDLNFEGQTYTLDLKSYKIQLKEENKQEIYVRIIEKLKADYKYNDLDNFLENYLKSESATYTKRSFLKFLREKI